MGDKTIYQQGWGAHLEHLQPPKTLDNAGHQAWGTSESQEPLPLEPGPDLTCSVSLNPAAQSWEGSVLCGVLAYMENASKYSGNFLKDGWKRMERMDGFPCLCCTQSTGITTKEIIPAGLTHCGSSAWAALTATPGIRNSIIPCSWGLECWVEGLAQLLCLSGGSREGVLSGTLHSPHKEPLSCSRAYPSPGRCLSQPLLRDRQRNQPRNACPKLLDFIPTCASS